MVRIKAIYDYNGSVDHIIRFSQGDEFELIDDSDENWWHVTLPRKGNEPPEHIYVPATYVKKVDGNPDPGLPGIDDLPPPPTDEELASISSTDLITTISETSLYSSEKLNEEWIVTVDETGRTYYFNTHTQTSQWDKPDKLKTPVQKRKEYKVDEEHYASLLPKERSKELRKPVNAASAVERPLNYMNIQYSSKEKTEQHYANIGSSDKHLSLQTTGQTTKNEITQQRRKHSSPSPTHPLSTSHNVTSLPRDSGLSEYFKRNNRPVSIADINSTVSAPIASSPNRKLFMRQLSDQLSPPNSFPIASFRRSMTRKSFKAQSPVESNTAVKDMTSHHGNSSFIEQVSISEPQPIQIPKQILDGYTEKMEDGDVVYICKDTQEKWRQIRSADKTHYQNKRTGERVWTLPVYKSTNLSAARTFSGGNKKIKSDKLAPSRSFSMSDYYKQNSNETALTKQEKSPVVKCEGLIKRKILQAPHDVKVDNKSWCSYYGVLKANTIYFYKDSKHCKRNEVESACDLTEDCTLQVDDDKRKGKIIKISKNNGLEMLLRAGDKTPTVEDWLESLSVATKTPVPNTPVKHIRTVSDSQMEGTVNGQDNTLDNSDNVDDRSIIDSKDITKKTINNYLHNRPTKDAQRIQDILTNKGIDISHLDKEKKKKVLTQLLSTRPSLEDLERKGLIKYTVFGCPLKSLCTRQRVQVPSVITQCVEAIEYRGIKSPGLYRISGNSAAIQKLRFKFDRCEDRFDSINLRDQEYEINMLTGFLKLFLRELPEPIIPYSQYPAIEMAIRTEEHSQDKCVQMLKHAIHSLPEPNKSTIIYIIRHLVRVSNESSENQMDVHNLSIIFGPSLLGNHPDKANLLADLPVQNRAVELIITHYKTILR